MQKRFTRLFSAIFAGIACLSGETITTVRVPPPPPAPVASDVSLTLAIMGAEAALEACNKIDVKVTVAVVDRLEHLRVLMVSDGLPASGLVAEVQDGAHTVLKTGMSSREYMESLAPNSQKLRDGKRSDLPPGYLDTLIPENQRLIDAGKADPHMYFVPGAVPIRKAGVIVGVVSAAGPPRRKADGTGFDTAEPCAIAGRDKIEAGF